MHYYKKILPRGGGVSVSVENQVHTIDYKFLHYFNPLSPKRSQKHSKVGNTSCAQELPLGLHYISELKSILQCVYCCVSNVL